MNTDNQMDSLIRVVILLHGKVWDCGRQLRHFTIQKTWEPQLLQFFSGLKKSINTQNIAYILLLSIYIFFLSLSGDLLWNTLAAVEPASCHSLIEMMC